MYYTSGANKVRDGVVTIEAEGRQGSEPRQPLGAGEDKEMNDVPRRNTVLPVHFQLLT